MRRAALGLLFALAAGSPAEAGCHRFKYWGFPWPQRCAVLQRAAFVAKAPAVREPTRAELDRRETKGGLSASRQDAEFAIPFLSLKDFGGGEPDETTRGRLMLRAALRRMAQ